MSRPSSPCHTRIWANEGPAASSQGGPWRLLSKSEVGRAQGNAAERRRVADAEAAGDQQPGRLARGAPVHRRRSEEHTSELQSRPHLVCRLLLEKKKIE